MTTVKSTPLTLVSQGKPSRVDRELHRACARFSEFMGHARLAAVVLDTDGRVAYCNAYLLDMTEWASDEVVGQHWFDYFLPPPHDESQALFDALLRDKPGSWHHENAILASNGDRILVRWNNSVVRAPTGEVIGVACIGEDLGEIGRNASIPVRATSHDPSHRIATASEVIAIADRLRHHPGSDSLTFLRLVADQCAQLAEDCGDGASGPAIARHIREMFRV